MRADPWGFAQEEAQRMQRSLHFLTQRMSTLPNKESS